MGVSGALLGLVIIMQSASDSCVPYQLSQSCPDTIKTAGNFPPDLLQLFRPGARSTVATIMAGEEPISDTEKVGNIKGHL